MKKLKYLNLLFFTIYSSLFYSQNKRIEIKLQNCTYDQIPENGKEIKQEIQEFESYLIEKKVLNNGTGKSYIELFRKIKKEDDINFDYHYSFSDSIQKIVISDVYKQMDCQIELINSPQYQQSKVYRLQNVIDSIKISGDIFPSKIANGILSVLDAEDFQLEYYKIKTFVLLDATNTTSELSRKLVRQNEEKFENFNLDNAIKIHINKKNEILVDNKKVSIQKLKKLIRKYESKNKSSSTILLTSTRDTIYKVYVDVQNVILKEISLLRKQLSLKKYGIEYNQLTKEQSFEIDNIYPEKLVEKLQEK